MVLVVTDAGSQTQHSKFSAGSEPYPIFKQKRAAQLGGPQDIKSNGVDFYSCCPMNISKNWNMFRKEMYKDNAPSEAALSNHSWSPWWA
jgi:hypothetical protein